MPRSVGQACLARRVPASRAPERAEVGLDLAPGTNPRDPADHRAIPTPARRCSCSAAAPPRHARLAATRGAARSALGSTPRAQWPWFGCSHSSQPAASRSGPPGRSGPSARGCRRAAGCGRAAAPPGRARARAGRGRPAPTARCRPAPRRRRTRSPTRSRAARPATAAAVAVARPRAGPCRRVRDPGGAGGRRSRQAGVLGRHRR